MIDLDILYKYIFSSFFFVCLLFVKRNDPVYNHIITGPVVESFVKNLINKKIQKKNLVWFGSIDS